MQITGILFEQCISVVQRGTQKEGQIYLNYLFMQGKHVFSDLKKKINETVYLNIIHGIHLQHSCELSNQSKQKK